MPMAVSFCCSEAKKGDVALPAAWMVRLGKFYRGVYGGCKGDSGATFVMAVFECAIVGYVKPFI